MAKVLVVDDDADHRAYVVELVERLGHSAISADNGQRCLHLVNTEEVDTVITDIFMPEADGIELVKALSERKKRIPVIGMTGGYRGVIEPYEHIFALVANATVLRKPFRVQDLSAALAEVLQNAA